LAGRSLNQENTTLEVGRSTIVGERIDAWKFRLYGLFLKARQRRNWATCRFRHLSTTLRGYSRCIHTQRTISHHVARPGDKRRHTLEEVQRGLDLLLMRLRYMTACCVLNHTFRSRLGAHHASRASEQTTASHPDRYADGEKQSHCLVREKQIHF